MTKHSGFLWLLLLTAGWPAAGLCQADSMRHERDAVKEQLVAMNDKLNKFLGSNMSPEMVSAIGQVVDMKWTAYTDSLTTVNKRQQMDIEQLKSRIREIEEKLKQMSDQNHQDELMERKLDVLYFDVGSFTLSAENKAIIRKIAHANADKTLQIVAYTDWVGDDGYNQALSSERAAAVQRELLICGFAQERIKIYSRGKMVSKQENLSAQECRRVEIRY
jgi:outer membrane protein OmpA-like peptidoglycan-associated protein